MPQPAKYSRILRRNPLLDAATSMLLYKMQSGRREKWALATA